MTRVERGGKMPNIYPRGDRRGFDNSFIKKAAFTLPEVLITIGVIGIVAAMTIPTLITKYQEKVIVTKFQQVFAILTEAYKLAENDLGENFRKSFDYKSGATGPDDFWNAYKPYLNASLDCKDNPDACFGVAKKVWGVGNYYTMLDSDEKGSLVKSKRAVILKNGVTVGFGGVGNSQTAHLYIVVDINGRNKPNRYGVDTFFFAVSDTSQNKIMPEGLYLDNLNQVYWGYGLDKGCNLKSSNQARSCAAWIFLNKNMDYLHCDLDWKTQTKCN